MVRIHLAADFGGDQLARLLRDRAEGAGFEVVWHGESAPDPGDDYPIYAVRVGRAVVEDQDAGVDAFGILVLDEPEAGAIAANKVNGARAVTASTSRAAARARAVVDANVLVVDAVAYEPASWLAVNAFVTARLPHDVDRGRRILQIQEYENAGTIEGWAVQLEPEQIAVSHP